VCTRLATAPQTTTPRGTSFAKSFFLSLAVAASLLMFSAQSSLHATTLIDPAGDGGFETGTTFPLNGWTVVNHTTNTWQVGTAATPFAGVRSTFVSNDGGTTSAYTTTVSQTSHFYRDVAVPVGETSITLTFQWKGNGESGFDRLLIYTAPTSVTPVAGTPASSSTTLTGATLVFTQPTFAQATYTSATVTLPASLAGTTFRLIFTWQNDSSGGVSPGQSVDNISLVSLAPANITSNPVVGNWSAPGTWAGGSVPASGDNVTIADGATVTIDTSPTVGTLTVGQGASGILQYDQVAIRTLTTNSDVTVAAGGTFKSSPTGSTGTVTTNSLSIGGALTNNGTLNFSTTAGASGTTANAAATQITFTGTADASFNCSAAAAITNLKSSTGVTLNKGTSSASNLTFTPPITYTSAAGATSSGTTITVGSTTNLAQGMFVSVTAGTGVFAANTTVSSVTDATHFVVSAAPTTALAGGASVVTASKFGTLSASALTGATAGFLSISNGTFKVGGSNTFNHPLFNATGYSIPSTGGIWLSNANFTLTAQNGSPTMSGLLRMTAGTYNVGTASGNSMSGAATSSFIIEGGTMNFASRLLVTQTTASFNISAGTINVNTAGNTSSASPSFGFTNAGSVFTMSGGTINLVQATTTGATLQDYQVSSVATVTGGTLNVGTAATATNFNFRIQGAVPALVVDNTTNAKTATLTASTTVNGNITINTGASLNFNATTGFPLFFNGTSVTNNGSIVGTAASTRFDFQGTGAQSYSGTGTWGTAGTPFVGFGVGIANTSNVTLNSPIVTTRTNLFSGTFINSNQITLGSGAALAVLVQRGGGVGASGSFDVAPTFNLGTGTYQVTYSTATTPVTTSVEIPATRTVTFLVIGNANGVTVAGGGLAVSGQLVLTVGNLVTTSSNLLTITGTATTAVSGGSATSYVSGPLARALPSAASGTYTFPVGKSAFKMLELVSPTTTGTATIQTEVFDVDSGGTGGAGFADISHTRYWNATITTGAANFTSSVVRLTEAVLAGFSIGQSATQTGTYTLVPSTVSGTTIATTAAVTSLNYFVVGSGTAISGSFEVGSTATGGSTFPTLTAAVAAYNSRIQTGPVTFLLTDAGYTTAPESSGELFPITINGNPGASATNTLTIKPKAGASPSMSSVASSTGMIVLNGADYVTIDGSNTVGGTSRDLTITNGNAGTSSAVIWGQTVGTTDSATNNTIKNVNLIGSGNTQTLIGVGFGSSSIGSASLGTGNNNNRVQNNNINTVQFGVYSQGASTSKNTGTVITSNVVGGSGTAASGKAGIYVGFEDGVQITSNSVSGSNPSNSADVFGIALGSIGISTTAFGTIDEVVNATVSRNTVNGVTKTDTFSAAGISVATATYGTTRVANNMVAGVNGNGTSGDFATGVYLGGSTTSTIQAYYNSVSMTGARDAASNAASPSFALAVLSTNPLMDIRDNILFNTQTSAGTGSNSYAIGLSSAAPFTNITSDYNDLFTSGTQSAFSRIGSLALSSGTDLAFAAWKATTTKDANSVSGNPQFTSTTDLHINPSVGTVVESAGTPIAGITIDIDGDTRNATTPDIGADEGTFSIIVNNDMQATAFVDPTNGGGKLAGASFSPQASFTNNGLLTQTSVTVRYRICTDGACTTTLYNNTQVIASIAPGASTTVTFASTSLSAGTYTMKAKSELAGDQVPANDEITGTFTVEGPLNGTYTVGSGGNYPSLTQAISKLNSLGVSGPVTISLLNENFNAPLFSGEVFPLTINAIAGASSTNTITIKPASGATVGITAELASSASAVFILNGASYVTIDGSNNGTSSRNLTITNNNTAATTAVIWMKSNGAGLGATNNVVKNCNLVAGSVSVATYGVALSGTAIGTAGADNDSNTIQNNFISKVNYGIYANGSAAVSAGGLDGLAITNNLIGPAASGATNTGFVGIWLGNAVSPSVSGNTVRNLTTSASNAGGIRLDNNVNGATVSQNFVTNINSSAGASGTAGISGIYLGSAVINSSILGNSIATVVSTTTSGYTARGLMVNTSNATSNDTIANNFITDVYCFQDASNIYWPIGIAIESLTGGVKIYDNSVNLFGSHTGYSSNPTGGAAPALFVNSSVTSLDVRGNIFTSSYDNSTSTGDKAYGIYSGSANTAYTTINYNDYFASGTGAPFLGFLGSDWTTIEAWRLATTQDAQSLSADPQYKSSTDLHIKRTTPAVLSPVENIVGAAIGTITTDFDGDTRADPPDIGADEVITIQFSSATYGVAENVGGGLATITVSRTAGAAGAAAVNYATVAGGSATAGAGPACAAGDDYITTTGTLNFASGDTSKTFTIPICNESLFEANETVNLALSIITGDATAGDPQAAVLTITNDDTAPTISIGNAPAVVEGGNAVFTVTQSAVSGRTTTFQYDTTDGSAIAPGDYTAAVTAIGTIPAGSPSTTISIPTNADGLYEGGNETFTVKISAPNNATIVTDTGTGTIQDGDTAPTFAIGDVTQVETNGGTTTFNFTVTKTGSTALDSVITYSTNPGTATSPSDFTAVTGGTITILAANSTGTIAISVNGDTAYEANETFTVDASNVTNGSFTDASGLGTITNDDAQPTATIGNVTQNELNSGTSTFSFPVTLSNPSSTSTTINYSTANGSATAGSDYVGVVSGSITIPALATSGNIDITVNGDTTFEPNETFTVTITSPDVLIGGTGVGTGTITNDDAQPTATIGNVTQNELNSGTSLFSFPVTLSNPSSTSTTINYSTADGSATAGSDYVGVVSGSIIIPALATSGNIDITVNGDTTYENNETFTVTITSPDALIGGTGVGTGTITNDDTAPTISINSASAAEGSNVVFTVTQSALTEANTTFQYSTANGSAVAPGDYTPLATEIGTIPAGSTTTTISVVTIDDTTREGDETFTVTLSNPANASIASGQGTGTGTITDGGDAPTFSIDNVSQVETNSGTTNFVFTVTKNGTTNLPSTVDYHTVDGTATAPSDYTAIGTTMLTFAPTDTTKTITVVVNGDTTVEPDETFTVVLDSPTGRPSSGSARNPKLNPPAPVATGTGTILNDDCTTPPGGMISWWSAEGNANDIVGPNNGTLHGDATYAAGKVGQAFSFDGVGDYVTIGDVDLPATFTIDAWINPNSLASEPVIISKDNSGITNYDLQIFPDGRLKAIVGSSAGTTFYQSNSSVITTGTWQHVALTYDGNAGAGLKFVMYVNGVLVPSSPVPNGDNGGTPTNGAGSATIGIYADQSSAAFNGRIDEVEIFSTVLSASDIAALYNASGAGKCHTSTLQFSSATYSVNESGTNATITVTRTGAHDTTATVDYATVAGGTATGGASCGSGTDYQTTSGTLTFLPNQTSQTFNVLICNDTTFEANETVNLALSTVAGAGASLGSPAAAVLTIQDNDSAPTVQFSSSTYSVNENAGPVTITITKTGDTELPATVSYGTSDGTATQPADYTATSGSVTFDPDQTTKTFTVQINDDASFEGNEDFTVTLSGPSGATLGSPSSATVTIIDDDALPLVQFDMANYDVNEAAGTVTLTVTKTGNTLVPATVSYATSNGSATAGSDYTTRSGTLTFLPNQSSQSFTVPITQDTVYEGNEQFTVTLSTPVGCSIGSPNPATVTILDDDDPPAFTIDNVEHTEGDSSTTSFTFTVTKTGATQLSSSVTYTTQNGTATVADSDYQAATGTLTFAAADTTKPFTVLVNGDTKYENNETFIAHLSTPVNATIPGAGNGTGFVDNDDDPPTISIDSVTVGEADGNAVFTVTQSAVSGLNTTFTYSTANGTAVAPGDYTAASNVAGGITAGNTTTTISIPIIDDNIRESSESFTVTLGNEVNASPGTFTGTGTITDNDSAPTFTIDDVTMAEGNSGPGTTNFVFTVTKNGNTELPSSVQYQTQDGSATAPSDYTALPLTTLNFAANETTKPVTVVVNGDTTYEADETFSVILSNPTGRPGGEAPTVSGGLGTITNDDTQPSFSINDVSHNEGNSGPTTYTFTVTKTGSTAFNATVDYATANNTATAPSDYTAITTTTLTFLPADTTKTITVNVNGDTTPELDETFFVNLTNPVGATISDNQGVGTIVNDDCDPLPSGMVGWWSGEGNANDIVGPNNGTLQGDATYAAGKVGQAFRFDGTGDYVSVPGTFGGGTEATVDAWVKVDALTTENPSIQAIVSSTSSEFIHFQLSNNTSGFVVAVYTNTGSFSLPIPTESPLGAWRHIAVTVKSGDSHIYVNGVQTGSSGATFGTITPTSNLRIGSGSGGARFFHGEIDEVEIFNRALSATEIADIYNAGSIGKCHTSTLQFSSPTYSASENGVNATITVTRTGAHDTVATVDYATVTGGTATGGASCTGSTDYVTTTNTLSFAANEVSKTFTISICDDAVSEGDETVNLQLSNVTGSGASLGAPSAAVLTISDDDCYEQPANMVAWYAGENNDNDIQGPTFENGSNSGAVTFAAGKVGQAFSFSGAGRVSVPANSGPLNITGNAVSMDGWINPTATGNAVYFGKGDSGFNDYVIFYDLGAPSVSAIIKSGGTEKLVRAFANYPTNTVFYTPPLNQWTHLTLTYDGSLIKIFVNGVQASQDAFSGNIAGDNQIFGIGGRVSGNFFSGRIDEVEVFNRALTPGEITSLYNSGVNGKCKHGLIQFSAPTYTVGEAGVNATITVRRTDGSKGAVMARFDTSNGTATAGSDYTATTNFTVSWPDGDASDQTVPIPITDDGLYEISETVNLALTNATGGAQIGPQGTATLTITDNDTAPTISINSVSVSEGGGNAVFTVTQSAVTGANTTFTYSTANGSATAGSDYTGATNVAGGITAGNTTTTISIPITDDGVYEGSEDFTVTLSSPVNATIASGQGTGTGTITDNDAQPSFAIDDITHNEGDSSTTTYTFTVTKSGSTALSSSVNFQTQDGTATIADSDYQSTSGPLNFSASDTTKTFNVLVNGDKKVETNEAFTVHLSGASNATISDADGTGTITNDDHAPVANNVSVSTERNVSKLITLSGTDSDGDTLTFSLEPGSLPAHGSLGPITPTGCCSATVLYTPDCNYTGPDSFGYKATDGVNDSNTATVSITVTPHTAPVVTNSTDNNAGSLRQALLNAQDGDTITFNIPTSDPGYDGGTAVWTITLTSGQLVVDKDVVISGPGADHLTVTRGAGAFRIFLVNSNGGCVPNVPDSPNGFILGNVTIEKMTISNGDASGSVGGGINNDHVNLTLNSCTLAGNIADFGGGLFNDGGVAIIRDSTLSGNSTGLDGGAVFNNGTLTVTNSTFSGNNARYAGGINNGNGGAATLTIANSTFIANGASFDGGGIRSFSGSVTLGNTIVAGNTAAGSGRDIAGTVSSAGYNLVGNTTNPGNFGATDQLNVDPMLGPLKNNGGPTKTHAPLINSPAIDQGKRDAIPSLTTNVDQRGSTRPVNDTAVINAGGGDGSDIGAVEIGSFVHPTGADSWKTHFGAGDFPVPLPLPFTSPIGVECRTGAVPGEHKIIVTFTNVNAFSGVAVTTGTGSATAVLSRPESPEIGGTQITINLTGVTNAQAITVALFGVDTGTATADVGVRMGVLLGDTTGDTDPGHVVNSSDVSQVQFESGHAINGLNFRTDLTTNGQINSSDVSTVQFQSGTGF
jgi:hypothetical protein